MNVVREIIGWLLVAAALYLVLIGLGFLSQRQVVEAGITAGLAIALYRGGLGLVKLSAAARALSPPTLSERDKS